MKLRLLISSTVLALSSQVQAEGQAHWSYAGNEGPEYWGDLQAEYQTCKLGQNQSPVNIEPNDSKALTEPLKMEYFATTFTLENNGHTLQANVTGKAPTISLDDKVYVLKQFHFHTPSEHTVKGQHYPLEIHFVHQAEDKSLAVLGVMVEEGKANPLLAQLVAKPLAKGEKEALAQPFEVGNLFPKDMTRFRLTGSLTTPPCSENVAWRIFQQPIQADKAQISAFNKIFGQNNRPLQPLNKRHIEVDK